MAAIEGRAELTSPVTPGGLLTAPGAQIIAINLAHDSP
jgi:hypothetical protein